MIPTSIERGNISERIISLLEPLTNKLVEDVEMAESEPRYKREARALLIDRLGDLTDEAKSGARDFYAADVLSIVALAVAATSPEIERDSTIRYEKSPSNYDNSYYDVLSVESGPFPFSRMNVPVPMIRPEFIQAIGERLKEAGADMEVVELGDHNRKFEHDPEEQMKAAVHVYQAIADLANVARIERLVGVVFDPHDEEGKEKIKAVINLIRQCRDASKVEGGIRDLARRRMEATRTLYGKDSEDNNSEGL